MSPILSLIPTRRADSHRWVKAKAEAVTREAEIMKDVPGWKVITCADQMNDLCTGWC